MSLGTERLKVRYRRYMDICYDHGGIYLVPSDTESQIEINYVLLLQKKAIIRQKHRLEYLSL